MASVHDLELSQTFRRWRRITRICMLVGPLLLFLAWRIDDFETRRVLIPIGVALVLAVFPMYSRWCNRCPRCRRSFSQAPGYAAVDTDDTSGVPLFNAIAKCPFCELGLDTARQYL